MSDGVRSMSGHGWWCLVMSDACLVVSVLVWWCLVVSDGVRSIPCGV